MIPILHISLLGEFSVISDETPITTIDSPRLQSLLAYLLLHRSAPQARSHLAYLLWPDSTDSQAHTNLRNVIYKLRQTLPEADVFLHIGRHALSWQKDAPWRLDVRDFEMAIAQAEQATNATAAREALVKAVKLYRGDLLPGCYDEWILPERDRLHQVFLKALERLIELQEQERDYDGAISSAQYLLRYDPLHEATYCQLMRLYAVRGNRAAALRTYHNCATMLERELAVQPSKATREAYESLLQIEGLSEGEKTSHPMLMATAPLVGRQQEWAMLQAAWRDATTGRAHFFLLSGEAGIGKTRLAEELLKWVERQGVTTAVARCYVAESEWAYAPVAAWLRSHALQTGLAALSSVWLTEVARLLPNLLVEQPDLPRPGRLVESWQRQRLFEALARAILQSKHPLLLLLDDIQWCDRETLEWLHYLLRFDPQVPLLLVGTVRSEEMTSEHPLASLLLSLRRDALATEVTLEPLNAVETANLAASLVGEDLDSAIVAALYQETEGNCLFVVETVRAGAVEKVRTGQLFHEGVPDRQAALLPSTVQAVIASRLAQLSTTAREVMSVAAVIGRAFTFNVLAHTSGMDEDALVQGLDELWQRRVVREQGGDSYDFSHEKLREQAYLALSAARRRLLHRRVGEALEALYTEDASALNVASGQIAVHYERAGIVERALVYYARAAEVARRVYANSEALAAYNQALSLLKRMPHSEGKREWQQEMSVQCYEGIGDILTLTGEVEAARGAYQNALARISMQERIRQAGLQRKVAKTWEIQYHFEEALQTYSAAETTLGSVPSTSGVKWWQEWIELQDKKMDMLGLLSRMSEVSEILEQLRPIVQQYGTTMQRAEFFFSSALTAARLNRFIVTADMLAEAHAGLEAYEEVGDLVKIGWSHLTLGTLYQLQENLTKADEHLREALTRGERTGDMLLQLRSLSLLALVHRKRGQVEEVRRTVTRALPIAAALQQPAFVGLNKANLTWIAWRERNMSEAQTYGLAALAEWQLLRMVYSSQWTALLPLIDIALTQEQVGAVQVAVDDTRLLLAPEQQRLPDTLSAPLEAAIGAWDDGQPEMARTYLQQAIGVAQEIGYL